MRWFIRTLLVWLMVLAVPAQGLAAATMAFCGPNHHGGMSDRVAVSDVSEHSHHGEGLSVHGLDASASAEHASTDATSVIEEVSQEAQQKCSACASCCSLGALLSSVPVVPAADPMPTVFITVVHTVAAVAADGPDRPPRYVLA